MIQMYLDIYFISLALQGPSSLFRLALQGYSVTSRSQLADFACALMKIFDKIKVSQSTQNALKHNCKKDFTALTHYALCVYHKARAAKRILTYQVSC